MFAGIVSDPQQRRSSSAVGAANEELIAQEIAKKQTGTPHKQDKAIKSGVVFLVGKKGLIGKLSL